MSIRPHLIRRVRRTAPALVIASLAIGLAVAAPADASRTDTSATPQNAIGAMRGVVAAPGGLLATGWAANPGDPTANTTVEAILDGSAVLASTVTSVAMPHVSKVHGLGPTPGFALTVPVPTGIHTVCIVAQAVGGGLDAVLKCVLTPLGRAPSPLLNVRHSPRGAMLHGWAGKRAVVFSGWADDPDDLLRPSVVTLYLDGSPAASQNTSTFTGPLPAGATDLSAFSFRVPVSPGAHIGCLWVTNVGFGQNTFLGCRAVDTRTGTPLTGGAPTSDNAKVVAEAVKHIGQSYTWGATGPKTFDCSGLVTYAYGKFGYAVPHQSGLQFAMARIIPAAQAVPGDLVFYHDSTGDVYHVGIYTGPGMTVAAIDTQEGVNYQPIYSATWATYGSFTHTAVSTS